MGIRLLIILIFAPTIASADLVRLTTPQVEVHSSPGVKCQVLTYEVDAATLDFVDTPPMAGIFYPDEQGNVELDTTNNPEISVRVRTVVTCTAIETSLQYDIKSVIAILRALSGVEE